MAYFVSVIFFLLVIVLAIVTADAGAWLISPPVLLAVVPASILLGVGATSPQAAKAAVRLSFSDAEGTQPEIAVLARRFLQVTGNQFLCVATALFLMGVVLLLVGMSESPEWLSEPARFLRFGTAILPLFYGMIFKCLFYSAEQKLAWKYV